jgi:hypothetical protein
MASNQLAIVGNHAGHGPAELGHAGGNLGHLVRAVDLGIAGIGAQPVERPGLDLARREDQVHGWLSRAGGRAEARRAMPETRSGSAMWGKTKAPSKVILRAQFFDDQ